MNLISKLAVASLLAGIALPAIAQDATGTASSALDSTVSTETGGSVSTEAGGSVSTDAGGVSVDASGKAKASGSASASSENYGSLISALQTNATADFETITEATTINFVTVSSLRTGADAQADTSALDNALSKNAEAHAKLKVDVTANAVLSSKLTAEGYDVEQVLAVVANADGSLTVYIDDRE